MTRDKKMGQSEVRDFDSFFCQTLMCKDNRGQLETMPQYLLKLFKVLKEMQKKI